MKLLTLVPLLMTIPVFTTSPAEASVGLFVQSTPPAIHHTDVVVFRSGNRASVAVQSDEISPETPWVFPVYPHMTEITLGTLYRDSLRSLIQTTSPRFERLVQATECTRFEHLISESPPTVPKIHGGTPASELLEYDELSSALPELTESHKTALKIEAQKGARFLVTRPDSLQIPVVSYNSELLELPTRLGQLNQTDKQHLRVFVISEKRHEVSNYWNAFSPTNVMLKSDVRDFIPIHQTVVLKSQEQSKDKFWLEFAGSNSQNSATITRLRFMGPATKFDDNLTLNPTSPVVGGQPDNLSGALGGPANNFKVRYVSHGPDHPDPNCPNPQLTTFRTQLVYADRWPDQAADIRLEDVVTAPIPELYVNPTPLPTPIKTDVAPEKPVASCSAASPTDVSWMVWMVGFLRRRHFKRT